MSGLSLIKRPLMRICCSIHRHPQQQQQQQQRRQLANVEKNVDDLLARYPQEPPPPQQRQQQRQIKESLKKATKSDPSKPQKSFFVSFLPYLAGVFVVSAVIIQKNTFKPVYTTTPVRCVQVWSLLTGVHCS
jgi:hypothetical protein